MKRYTLFPSPQMITLSCLATIGIHAGCGPLAAEDIFIDDHSFEDDAGAAEFSLPNPTAWPRYIIDENMTYGLNQDFVDGVLNLDFPDSPWFNDPAPDGNNVLLLYTPPNADVTSEFGVQQILSATLQDESQYTLQVDVGNIQTGVAQDGTEYFLNGFPGYRIEILAGDFLLGSDIYELYPGEGEFETSEIQFYIPQGYGYAGLPITIRLINMNIGDGFANSRTEVDFDNVRLTRIDHSPGDPGWVPPEINSFTWLPADSNGDKAYTRPLTITGKGKKRILVTGRGPSLPGNLPDKLGNPTVEVRSGGKVIAKSVRWMREKQAREIRRVDRFPRSKWHGDDAGAILELEPGDYTLHLTNADGKAGYGILEVYDLDPDAPSEIEPLDKVGAELIRLWNRL